MENNKQKTKEIQSKKESEFDRFMESFECSFCFQTYVDPVTASCHAHNFCKLCLQTWISTQLGDGLEATCPTCCIKIQQSPDDLQINVGLRDMITSVQQMMRNKRSEDHIESEQVKNEKVHENPHVAAQLKENIKS